MQDKNLNKFVEKSAHLIEANASIDEAWGKMNELLSKENIVVKNKKSIFKKSILSLLLLLLLIPTCHYFNNIFFSNTPVVKKGVNKDSTKKIDVVLSDNNTTLNISDTISNKINTKNGKVLPNKSDEIKNNSTTKEKKILPKDNNILKNKILSNKINVVINKKSETSIDQYKSSKIKKANSLKGTSNGAILDLNFVENNKNNNVNKLEGKEVLNLKKQKNKKDISLIIEKKIENNNAKKDKVLNNIRSNDSSIGESTTANEKNLEEKKKLLKTEKENEKFETINQHTKVSNADSSSEALLKNVFFKDSLTKDELVNNKAKKSPKKKFSKLSYGLNWQLPIPITKGTFTNVYGNNSAFTNIIPELFVEKIIGKNSSLLFTFNPYFEYADNEIIINKEEYIYTTRRSSIGPATLSYLVDSLTYEKTLSINKTIGIAGIVQYKRRITSKFSIAYGIGFVQQVYGIVNNKLEAVSGENLLNSTYSISKNNQLWENVNKNIFINRLDVNYKIKPRWELGLSVFKPFNNILKNEAEDKKPFNFKLNLRWFFKNNL